MDIRLGTRYYTVRNDGSIVSKVVLTVPFEFPNNSFTSVRDAIMAAIPKANTCQDTTDSLSERKRVLEFMARMKEEPVSVTADLESAPVFSLDDGGDMVDVETLSAVSYIKPGTKVWLPVSPGTQTKRQISPEFAHIHYFVLETSVLKVEWTGRGLFYRLDSRYSVPSTGQLHESLNSAKLELGKLIENEVPAIPRFENFTVLSSDIEKLAHADRWAKLRDRVDLMPHEP